MYTLYDYFRSTASYRVRIVLELKQLAYQCQEVHLVNNGGEQNSQDYTNLNPQQLVPTLVENNEEQGISQSLAIINYLEAKHPAPSLFTNDIKLNAQINSFALQICCDLHPLNNLRVLNYLTKTLNNSETQKMQWYHHWLKKGFSALEKQLEKTNSNADFCFANKITLADVCLIPQIYNANRFKFDMTPYPILKKINKHCLSLEAFQKAAP